MSIVSGGVGVTESEHGASVGDLHCFKCSDIQSRTNTTKYEEKKNTETCSAMNAKNINKNSSGLAHPGKGLLSHSLL